jgi:hypothetical protein
MYTISTSLYYYLIIVQDSQDPLEAGRLAILFDHTKNM